MADQHLHLGLGTAIRRLMDLEFRVRAGAGGDTATQEERALLLKALDVVPVAVGFDCDEDGQPDTVEIFQKAAATSCCRLLALDEELPARAGSSSSSFFQRLLKGGK